MQAEHSYGILPLRQLAGQWQIFLIRHRAGHWSFPKGHQNGGESPRETASRELFEETGLSIVKFLPYQEIEEHYIFQRKEGTVIDKRVTYFMAEVKGEVKIQEEELDQGKWVPLAQARELITFEEARKVCTVVQSLLT